MMHMLTSLTNFLHALQLRVGPSYFGDSQGKLFKLILTTVVSDYQSKFGAISNKIIGLPPHFLLSCFISGLKPHIKREAQSLQPLSLMHAIELAKFQE